MGFLESVGMLAIIAVLLIVYIRHISTRDSKLIKPSTIQELDAKKTPQAYLNAVSERDKVEAIKKRIIDSQGTLPVSVPFNILKEYSTKCKDAEYEFRDHKRFPSGRKFVTFDQELKRILKEPLEYWQSVEKYLIHIAVEQEQKLRMKRKDELFIKYAEIVFTVFNEDSNLMLPLLISRLKSRLKIDEDNAFKIFNIWEEYGLIHCSKLENRYVFEIDTFLKHGKYDSEFKITQKEWLANNHKNLK